MKLIQYTAAEPKWGDKCKLGSLRMTFPVKSTLNKLFESARGYRR
jgi:hypothetical protein